MAEIKVFGGEKEFVRHVLSEINGTGDTKVLWNPRDADEVENARAAFNRLIGKGFKAFRVGENGEAVPPALEVFDPSIEKMVLAPQMAGGAPGERDVLHA